MPDVQILAPGTHPSPLDYEVPGAQEILIKSVAAKFNGVSAAGSYVPCLELIAPGGVVAATCPLASSVAAGSSVDVSWFPRGGLGVSGSGGGIRFDVDNQGGSLRVTANTVAPGGTGILMDDQSGGPSEYRSANDLDVNAGQDINEVAVRDWNLQGGQDVNVVASRDLNMSTLVRDVNVLAKGKLSLAARSSDVVAAASLDLSTAGAGFSILDHLGNPIVTWTG